MLTIISKEAEVKLVEKIAAPMRDDTSSRALKLNFSHLLDQYKTEYQRKITLNIISDHLREDEGVLFICQDNDIFLISPKISRNSLDKLIFQLRYLYSDDPLAYNVYGQENPEFCKIYEMHTNQAELEDEIKRKAVSAARKGIEKTVLDYEPKLKKLTPARLAVLEKDLAMADISQVLRHQPVCAVQKGRDPKELFEELYINIAHLQKSLANDVNLFSSQALFRYLTQVLDVKLLDMIARRPAIYFESSVSLNLNIETILSSEFINFDHRIKPSLKVSVVVEIQASDVIENTMRFAAARERLLGGGYRMCLDGLSYLNFIQLDRERLGFDLAKLQWNAELDVESNPSDYWKLREAILKYGAGRVILCRCDTPKAIEFGHSLGLSLFQGRYLDYLLYPKSRVTN